MNCPPSLCTRLSRLLEQARPSRPHQLFSSFLVSRAQRCPCLAASSCSNPQSYNTDVRPVARLVRADFSQPCDAATRFLTRHSLGFADQDRVHLMTTGLLGVGDFDETIKRLLEHPKTKVLVLCGRKEQLRQRLEALALDRVVALGWRNDVRDLFHASDVLLHNAGGMLCNEAFVAGLPVVTYRPIPGHELADAEVLERKGRALWPKMAEELNEAIDSALNGEMRQVLGMIDLAQLVLEEIEVRE